MLKLLLTVTLVVSVDGFASNTSIVSRGQTFLLTSALLICSACGHLSDSAFIHRQRLADARKTAVKVLDVQATNDNLDRHVLVQDHNGHHIVGKIIEHRANGIYIQPYRPEYRGQLVIVNEQEILGTLVANHRHLGLEIALPSEEVGIKHLVGQVFAVYDSNMYTIEILQEIDLSSGLDIRDYDSTLYAIRLLHKLDFSGKTSKLEYEDGKVLRFVHRRNLLLEE